MISLRLRLALVLIVAIVSVVVVAVFLTTQITRDVRDGSLERAFVQSAQAIADLVDHSPERARQAGLTIEPPPPPERREEVLPNATAETVIVSDEGSKRHLALRLTDEEWLRLPFPTHPPSPFVALFAYLSLVVAGTTAIALLVAARIMGPMRMLEGALSTVRPDGTLSPVPERGPPEVRATARALNALSGRLKTAMESRMRLVAAAGHDLRTPMTRLRLRAEFLPEGEREKWLRDLEELDHIADSAIRLVREEVDETNFTPQPLEALVAEIVGELSEIGLLARFEDSGEGIEVPIQPLAMKRALRNLIENAARHGGGATVRLERRGNEAAVVIEDRGPGIPVNLMDRVFEPFFRVDAARRKSHEGAGLGLAIAREIVERHDGTLSLRNREGGGLRQDVLLPLPVVDSSF